MVINTNIVAMAASRNLAASMDSLSSSLARLSSGSKIVAPEDDAVGLAQSIRLGGNIKANDAILSNINNAISFSQTQDSILEKAHSAAGRMEELAFLSLDNTKTDTDRSNYVVEFKELQNFIYGLAEQKFNGLDVFSSDNLNITIGSNGETFSMTGIDVSQWLPFLVNPSNLSINNVSNAEAALDLIKLGTQFIADARATIGAHLMRLKSTDGQISIYNENLKAANSRINDVDMARESTQYARTNILFQNAHAMLAQSNLLPATALKLLG